MNEHAENHTGYQNDASELCGKLFETKFVISEHDKNHTGYNHMWYLTYLKPNMP